MSKVISFTGQNLGHATTVVESEVTLGVALAGISPSARRARVPEAFDEASVVMEVLFKQGPLVCNRFGAIVFHRSAIPLRDTAHSASVLLR
jgi:hypothetical protein